MNIPMRFWYFASFALFAMMFLLNIQNINARAQDMSESPVFLSFSLNDKGLAVVKGKAKPQTQIELLDGARKMGETMSDHSGNFTIIFNKHLGYGQYQFVLRAIDKDNRSLTSMETAMVAVSDKINSEFIAVVNEPGGAKKIISGKPEIIQSLPITVTGFKVNQILYENDNISIFGNGPVDMQVMVSLGEKRMGTETINLDGSFIISRKLKLQRGDYVFRLDLMNESGESINIMGVPFHIESGTQPSRQTYDKGKPVKTTVVREKETLSHIAQRIYGDRQYDKKIFDANRGILHDMNHIEVGQELILPPADDSNEKKKH